MRGSCLSGPSGEVGSRCQPAPPGLGAGTIDDLAARATALRSSGPARTSKLPAAPTAPGRDTGKQGEPQTALLQYCCVMSDMQSQGLWVIGTTTPPVLVPLVEHAVRQVRDGRRALYRRLLAPLAAEFRRRILQRVQQALRIYLGRSSRTSPMHASVPRSSISPAFPPHLFLALAVRVATAVEATPAIPCAEPLSSAARGPRQRAGLQQSALEDENLRGTRVRPAGPGIALSPPGQRRADNCAACPQTSAALERLPLSRARRAWAGGAVLGVHAGHAPLAHRGVTNTRAVGHLPLIVPAGCALKVGGGTCPAGGPGRGIRRYPRIRGLELQRRTRVVLIFDLWNPHMTDVERGNRATGAGPASSARLCAQA